MHAEFWRRDFRLLWSGSAISQLGTIGAAAASPLLALSLTNSPVFAGWVTAASTAPGLLLHLPAGLLVDGYDRRRIMLISQAIRALTATLLVAALFTAMDPRPLLIAAAAIDGACAVFYKIAEVASVQHIVPTGELEASMGKNEARQHIALVFGRPLGGLLFSVDRTLPYIVDAISSLLSITFFGMMRTKRFQSRKFRPSDLEDVTGQSGEDPSTTFREGIEQLRRDRFVRVIIGACAAANMAFQAVILLLVVEAERRLSGSVIGALLATSGISGFIGAAIAPRIVGRFGPERTAITCVWLWLPLMIVVAMVAHPIPGMIAWGLCSFMGAHINVALAVHQAKHVPGHLLGRVTGINSFLTTGAVAVGASAGGYLITWLGTRCLAHLAAAAFALIAIMVLLSLQPDSLADRTCRRLGRTCRFLALLSVAALVGAIILTTVCAFFLLCAILPLFARVLSRRPRPRPVPDKMISAESLAPEPDEVMSVAAPLDRAVGAS